MISSVKSDLADSRDHPDVQEIPPSSLRRRPSLQNSRMSLSRDPRLPHGTLRRIAGLYIAQHYPQIDAAGTNAQPLAG